MFHMESSFEDVIDVLGGRGALGAASMHSFHDLHKAIEAGIPIAVFHHAIRGLGESESPVAGEMGIARTTLSRRKAAGRLGHDESERVVRLGMVVALGRIALGSTQATGRWLLKPNHALGGEKPPSLLRTDVGAREVEAVLGRALFGGYS